MYGCIIRVPVPLRAYVPLGTLQRPLLGRGCTGWSRWLASRRVFTCWRLSEA